ncbi:sulfatase-like hydrolase/transferase [Phenylobacterium sp.]|uniref:sulfatase-like hydrolase/transferase n=1 Tax=Phenylobacterium sp. TaxID=1871053 RepID=UPI002FE39181
MPTSQEPARPTGRRRRLARGIVLSVACLALAAATGIAPDGRGPAAAQAAEAGRSGRPNVIVILADDLGHNDLSIAGNPLVRTPNIDSIGRQGVRFATGYAADAVCAPSRAALLTGRYPQRYGFEYLPYLPGFQSARDGTYGADRHKPMVLPLTPPPPEKNGLALSEVTLAEILKARGYRTGAVGKWHLGYDPKLTPTARGFDEFVGVLGGSSLYADQKDPDTASARLPWSGIDNYLWETRKAQIQKDGKTGPLPKYMTYALADEAVGFVERNRDRPFFLYLAFTAPHNPLQAPKAIYDRLDHIKDEKTRVYYAMIEAMDEAVGRVLAAVEQAGLADDTIIIFTSDNGGAFYHEIPQENLPYRGWKTSYFEGGVNVPFLMRWNGRLPAGRTVPGVVSALDIVPTVASATGARLPRDREFDGRDLLPVLTGTAANDLDGRTLVWRKEDYRAIRHGRWKLQTTKYPEAVWLHDLETDPTERINLAARLPDKVRELQALFAEREKAFAPPAWTPAARTRIDIDGYSPSAGDDVEHIYWTN